MARRPADQTPTTPRRRSTAAPRTAPVSRTTPRPQPPTRPAAEAPEPPLADAARAAGWGGLGGLLRGGGSVIGQISGMDGPARSLDRLATSSERAAALVERLEAEVTVEFVLETLERLHRLADVIEEMNRSVRAMEIAIVDLHTRVAAPLDQFPLRGLRRRRKVATPDA